MEAPILDDASTWYNSVVRVARCWDLVRISLKVVNTVIIWASGCLKPVPLVPVQASKSPMSNCLASSLPSVVALLGNVQALNFVMLVCTMPRHISRNLGH